MRQLALVCLLACHGAMQAAEPPPLRSASCQLDEWPEHAWPTRREMVDPPKTGPSDPVAAEYLAHRRREGDATAFSFTGAIRIDWDEAKRMILRGYVTDIVQSHDLGVVIRTNRGSVFSAKETGIDEVFVVASVVDPCRKFIRVITE